MSGNTDTKAHFQKPYLKWLRWLQVMILGDLEQINWSIYLIVHEGYWKESGENEINLKAQFYSIVTILATGVTYFQRSDPVMWPKRRQHKSKCSTR